MCSVQVVLKTSSSKIVRKMCYVFSGLLKNYINNNPPDPNRSVQSLWNTVSTDVWFSFDCLGDVLLRLVPCVVCLKCGPQEN